jgi:cytochrome c5
MKLRLLLAVALIYWCGQYIAALAQTSTNQPAKNAQSNSARNQSGSTDEGEKRFRTNCGRCHNPPEDISPREARAVVRQMRVRAMLSAEDEKLILEFLAP